MIFDQKVKSIYTWIIPEQSITGQLFCLLDSPDNFTPQESLFHPPGNNNNKYAIAIFLLKIALFSFERASRRELCGDDALLPIPLLKQFHAVWSKREWKTQYSWPWSFPDRQPGPRLVGNFQCFPPENGGHAKYSPRSNYFCNLQTLIEETKHVTIDELGWKATIHIPLVPFCVFSPLPHSLLQSPSHIIRHLFSIFFKIRFLLCWLIPPHCASVRRVYFFQKQIIIYFFVMSNVCFIFESVDNYRKNLDDFFFVDYIWTHLEESNAL